MIRRTETERMMLAQTLADVTKLIKAQYFAARIGIDNSILTAYTRPFASQKLAPSDERVEKMNAEIQYIARHILAWHPLTYGCDVPAILKLRKQIINLPYIFIDVLGHTPDWMKKHMTDRTYKINGKEYRYYNTFTEKDIQDINNAITVLATRLKSITVHY